MAVTTLSFKGNRKRLTALASMLKKELQFALCIKKTNSVVRKQRRIPWSTGPLSIHVCLNVIFF